MGSPRACFRFSFRGAPERTTFARARCYSRNNVAGNLQYHTLLRVLLIGGNGRHIRRDRHQLTVVVFANYRFSFGRRRRAAEQLVGELRVLVRVLLHAAVPAGAEAARLPSDLEKLHLELEVRERGDPTIGRARLT